MIRLAILLSALALTGCASTLEIETSPPKPRANAPEDTAAAAREAPLEVVMVQGETPLPDAVSRLRFRVTEIRLHREGGPWVRLPSDAGPTEFVTGGRGAPRTLLEARVAPATYDSLTIAFDDVFVHFGPNAGAPLTTANEAPQQLALALDPALGTRTTVVLKMEPAASLTRSPDCRWFFVPILRTDVTSRTITPAESSR